MLYLKNKFLVEEWTIFLNNNSQKFLTFFVGSVNLLFRKHHTLIKYDNDNFDHLYFTYFLINLLKILLIFYNFQLLF